MSNFSSNILQCLLNFFIQELGFFIYFGHKANILTFLNLYNGRIFICGKLIVRVTNQKEQRMIRKQFYSWHLRWVETKMTVKFYSIYEYFSHLPEITEGYFEADLEDCLFWQERIARVNRLWNIILYQNRYYSYKHYLHCIYSHAVTFVLWPWLDAIEFEEILLLPFKNMY